MNDIDERGNTTLMQAVISGDMKLVEACIFKGANLEAVNLNGETAILLAANLRNLKFVLLLMKHGANIDVMNYKNETVGSILAATSRTRSQSVQGLYFD